MNHAPKSPARQTVAVLTSGGIDSAILVAESARTGATVWPLYIRTGLAWESVEFQYLCRFLEQIACPGLEPLQVLDLPVNDLYGDHWSLSGRNVPDADSADEAVFLPGRNLLLLSKSMLWCHLRGVPTLMLALLKANPFPDATPSFFAACQSIVNESVGGHVKVVLPFAKLSKAEVLKRGKDLPLELTFSCIRPAGARHCGRCNKCAERRRGFLAAGMLDKTDYATGKPCTL